MYAEGNYMIIKLVAGFILGAIALGLIVMVVAFIMLGGQCTV